MKNTVGLIVCFLIGWNHVSAQISKKLDYEKHASDVRNEVWAWTLPEFERRNVPDEYSDASSVILACHNEILAKSREKIRFSPFTLLTANNELYYVNTVRQLVKINDEAALDEYSEFSFQKLRKRSGRAISNTMLTVAGARIIKPDGSIREIDMDEAVMTRDEKRDQQSKIAVSGLQIGDMIDYFIRVEEQMDNKDIDPQLFIFGSDVPMLSYSVHCEIGNRFTVEYRTMNGAPDFTRTTNADSDFVLDARMENVAALPIELWMSPIRQMPVLRLHILDNNSPMSAKTSRKPGTIHPNIDPQLIIDEATEYIGWSAGRYTSASTLPYFSKIRKLVKEYKLTHNSEPDSIAQLVYYALRHYLLNGLKDQVVVDNRRNYQTVNNVFFAAAYERTLRQLKIPCKYIFLASRYGPPLEEIFAAGDLSVAVSTMTDNPMIICAEGVFTPADYIPVEYESGASPAMFIKKTNGYGRATTQKENPVDIPVSGPQDNSRTEEMTVKINPDEPDELMLSRMVTINGDLKSGYQELLLMFEQYESEERKALGIKTSFMDDLMGNDNKKSLLSEYLLAFQEAQKKQIEQFETEMSEMFGIKPKEITNHKVYRNGIMHQRPELIYGMDCIVDGWVKKAGNNFLVDIGKLNGTQLSLKPKDRNRTTDIYMPCARSYTQNIEMEIPEGFNAEGYETLTRNIRNQCGEFTVDVRREGNKLFFLVRKIYAHDFEPAENWPMLLEIIDAANEWSDQKVMLRKL